MFSAAPLAEWVISESVEPARRARLLEDISLEDISAAVTAGARVVSVRLEHCEDAAGYERTVLRLEADPVTADRWQNGRSGYRAQYYRSEAAGEAADRLLVRNVLARMDQLAESCPSLQKRMELAQISMADPFAKVWVHQGTWCRKQLIPNRTLLVKRWMDRQSDLNRKTRWLARAASQMPIDHLEIIGGWVDASGRSLARSLKPDRSSTLHQLGFT